MVKVMMTHCKEFYKDADKWTSNYIKTNVISDVYRFHFVVTLSPEMVWNLIHRNSKQWQDTSSKKKQIRVTCIPWITNYLSKFCPSTGDVCEALRQLTSVKTEWTWNATYQKLFDRAKSIIKADAYMKFYKKTKLLYLETDASGVGLRAS